MDLGAVGFRQEPLFWRQSRLSPLWMAISLDWTRFFGHWPPSVPRASLATNQVLESQSGSWECMKHNLRIRNQCDSRTSQALHVRISTFNQSLYLPGMSRLESCLDPVAMIPAIKMKQVPG